MADKKIVDDYYSNIGSDENQGKSEADTSKLKIKAKRKVVVKKATPITDATKKETSPVKTLLVIKKADKPQKTIQRITVIKRDDIPKPVKRESIKEAPTRSFGVNKAPDSSNSNFKTKKTFVKSGNMGGKDEFGKVKRKGFVNSRTRGKIRGADVNEEFALDKTNKLARKKKEEKKVEDIKQNLVDRKGETVTISEFLTLKEFSEKIGVGLPHLMAEFMKNGVMVNINSKVDFETASIIAEAFDIKLEKDNSSGIKIEDIMSGDIAGLLFEDDITKLEFRSPVISIMGHVDHGKTSLLDHIRKSKVTDGEAGGITQSIGAYQVEHGKGKITFLDTPGHEAFTIMRARGAKSTDIAILVVAADEGVKPQTIESINHAKEAGIPVIVAINKMDKEGANPDHVKGQLSEHGLMPEDWGGDIPMIPVSAHTGFGIDELLEIILLVAEMKELKANPNRRGVATIIESHLDQKLGPVATVLINTGTLNKTDNIVCQDSYGKVKILKDHMGKNIKFAIPGQPVLIVGLDRVVDGGDILQVVSSSEIGKQKAVEYKEIKSREKLNSASGLELLMSKIKAGNLKQLKIILKADTNGALEAIKGALLKLSTPETTVSIIHSGVGNINEGDVLMSQGSEAILIGFSVGVVVTAKKLLESKEMEYINSNIIYHITDRIEKIVSGMLDPKEVEVILGQAKVGGVFYTSNDFMVLGLILQPDNKIETKAQIRVIRNKKMIGSGKIETLKSGLLEVKELEGPIECGIKFIGNVEVEMKDTLEIYKVEIQK